MQEKSEKELTFIDLFSGIGGFRLGMEKQGFKCVWSCDIDKYANQVYRYRFGGENHEEGDIREVDAGEIPDFDILCAGFPCQSFSVAGRREGFDDPRGTLFFEICRIARVKKPRLLFLENVKGLLSNERGRTFATILNSLQELGYSIEWQVLDSQHFGVPQHRERVFIIGHLGGFGGRQIFPIGKNYRKPIEKEKERQREKKWVQANDVCATVDARYYKGGSAGTYILDTRYRDIRTYTGNAPTLTRNMGVGGQHVPLVLPRILKVDIDDDVVINTLTEAVGTRQGSSKEFIKSVENILKAKGQLRRLTPKECERLQGFPDDWTKWGINEKGEKVGISDTQRYRMIGNAVTVNVIEAIASDIMENEVDE